jgi:hypothetical protein
MCITAVSVLIQYPPQVVDQPLAGDETTALAYDSVHVVAELARVQRIVSRAEFLRIQLRDELSQAEFLAIELPEELFSECGLSWL